MTTFDDREKGMEKLFAHDEELKFRASARRNKLLGLWAAELLGKHGAAADGYALEVIKADLEKPGEDDLIDKLRADFDAGKVELSNHLLLKKMDDLMHEAVAQLESEKQ